MSSEQTATKEVEKHPDANNDAEMLAVLDGIMGPEDEAESTETSEDTGETKEQKAARERRPDGKFAKKETADEKVTEPEAKSKETPQPAVPEGVNPVEYATAIQALHRDGVPPSVIESMKPKDVVSWGVKRSTAQKEVDGFASKIKELEKRPESPKEPVKAPELNLDEAIRPFVEQYGDESAGPLKAFGEALAQQVYEKTHSDVSEWASRLEATEQRLLGQEREAVRTGLEKQYKLDQPERWQQVLERRAIDGYPYTSESDALRASCQVLFSDELLAEAGQKKADNHKARSNGQPMTASKGSPPDSMTKAQKHANNEMEILNAILDGDDDRVKDLSREGEKLRMFVG